MLSKDIYNKLKQTNISQDCAKTKERVKAAWVMLDRQQKQEVFNISDLKKATLERTCREGNISVKLAAALAEISRVDPYYFAGVADDKVEDVPDSLIESFLIDHNYKHVIAEAQKNAYYKQADFTEDYPAAPIRSVADMPEGPPAPPAETVLPQIAANVLESLSDDDKASLEAMSEDDMIYLLKSINLRARFSEEARSTSILLKKILIG